MCRSLSFSTYNNKLLLLVETSRLLVGGDRNDRVVLVSSRDKDVNVSIFTTSLHRLIDQMINVITFTCGDYSIPCLFLEFFLLLNSISTN